MVNLWPTPVLVFLTRKLQSSSRFLVNSEWGNPGQDAAGRPETRDLLGLGLCPQSLRPLERPNHTQCSTFTGSHSRHTVGWGDTLDVWKHLNREGVGLLWNYCSLSFFITVTKNSPEGHGRVHKRTFQMTLDGRSMCGPMGSMAEPEWRVAGKVLPCAIVLAFPYTGSSFLGKAGHCGSCIFLSKVLLLVPLLPAWGGRWPA